MPKFLGGVEKLVLAILGGMRRERMDEATLVIFQSSLQLLTLSDQLWKSLDQVETLRKLPDCIKKES